MKMFLVLPLLVLWIIGSDGAREPDIDINRIKLLPREEFYTNRPHSIKDSLSRRSIIEDHRTNDYDHSSIRFNLARPSVHDVGHASSHAEAKTRQIYQPREDPRLFYQSDTYVKEANRKNLNKEMSSIYLEKGVVKAGEHMRRSMPIRSRDRYHNSIDEDICVQCPHDRTLITKAGADHVLLIRPRVLTCSGRKAPRNVRFTHMYGPKFGSLLTPGSHVIIGRITSKDEVLQTCKIQINVLIQSCTVPRHLVNHCQTNKTCQFTCRDTKTELVGNKELNCGDDMKWSGRLPACAARTWCPPPPPPDHGKLSCKAATAANGWGLNEGSSCRLKCDRGWRWTPRAIAVCRRGKWTHGLKCEPKRKRPI